mmetsp:Transcript_33383/g.55221  ORF Transcript_33383/g.55221 Transcript_33383/m.55221 type:complete len:86 (+) Transcript_33383:673-930(+)
MWPPYRSIDVVSSSLLVEHHVGIDVHEALSESLATSRPQLMSHDAWHAVHARESTTASICEITACHCATLVNDMFGPVCANRKYQ